MGTLQSLVFARLGLNTKDKQDSKVITYACDLERRERRADTFELLRIEFLLIVEFYVHT